MNRKTVNIREQLDEGGETTGIALTPGQKVGEYIIEGRIGSGGFGDVYQAKHPVIGKRVAIKILAQQYKTDDVVGQRFVNEARAVNEIRHKNIVDVFGFGEFEDGRHYMIMELLEGQPLDRYLKERRKLSVEEAVPILDALGSALDAAHDKGIIHRDLKPENVFLVREEDGSFSPKLLDFGIAKLIGKQDPGDAALGTATYMSPEQCDGADVDRRSDIYSFGVLTYRVLTGRLPHTGERPIDVYIAKKHERPKALGLGETIDKAVLAMLAKDPSERPPNLQAALAPLCIPDSDEPTIAPAPPASSTRSVIAVVALAVLLAAGIAGGLQLVPPDKPPLRIGIRRYLSDDELNQQYAPALDALESALDRDVELESFHVADDISRQLLDGRVSFAVLNAYLYPKAKMEEPRLSIIARPITPAGGTFEAYVIARADSGMSKLTDLAGKTFCYVPGSGSGYFYPRYLLHKAGVHPDRDLKATRLVDTHTAALRHVAAGRCDATGVFTAVYTGSREQGIAPETFTILAKFPRIPYDVWVAGPDAPEEMVAKMRSALLGVQLDPAGEIVGFEKSTDADFEAIKEVAQYLKKHAIE